MKTSPAAEGAPAAVPHLVRLSETFAGIADEVLKRFGATSCTRLGLEYYLIKTATPEAVRQSEASTFARWNLPMEHSWPCHPAKMEGFIEKAAQALLRKFGARKPQGIFIGLLNPGSPDKYYKSLATNLRGRLVQLFPQLAVQAVEEQNPEAETLFCLLGKEGLFCGMQSPKASNGFYAGGSKHVPQDAPDTISRAGAKIAEALHYLRLHRPPPPVGSRWLELGACPGGMTSELLAREYRVTAIDRAPLDKRLNGQRGLTFILGDAAEFEPSENTRYDAILSDMSDQPHVAIGHVMRLSSYLNQGGLAVFALKMPRVETVDEPLELLSSVVERAEQAGLHLIAKTHLTYNRHEFTLFFEKR